MTGIFTAESETDRTEAEGETSPAVLTDPINIPHSRERVDPLNNRSRSCTGIRCPNRLPEQINYVRKKRAHAHQGSPSWILSCGRSTKGIMCSLLLSIQSRAAIKAVRPIE